MFSTFDIAALLLTLTAAFGWLNRRLIHLPHTIGLLVMGILVSILLALADRLVPGNAVHDQLMPALKSIDFTHLVMNGMLAFLLFAGALGVDVDALREHAFPVVSLAVVGTLASTVSVAGGFWGVARLLGHPLPFIWALVFGALISPTDPIAVLKMLRSTSIVQRLRIEMQGEALFNDGLGVVLFTLFLGVARSPGSQWPGAADIALRLLREGAGGLALGVASGYVAYRAMQAIDDFAIEVLITLALATGTYALAQKLGTSGPLSVVAAGLLIGQRAKECAMSDQTKRYVIGMWTLVDEVLNSVLFLLIGLEVILLRFEMSTFVLAIAAIPIVLAARFIAVLAPLALFPWSQRFLARNVPFLTWAGVHGGISMALVLALPDQPITSVLLAATCAVVVFSLIVQGSTLGWMARHTLPDGGSGSPQN